MVNIKLTKEDERPVPKTELSFLNQKTEKKSKEIRRLSSRVIKKSEAKLQLSPPKSLSLSNPKHFPIRCRDGNHEKGH